MHEPHFRRGGIYVINREGERTWSEDLCAFETMERNARLLNEFREEGYLNIAAKIVIYGIVENNI